MQSTESKSIHRTVLGLGQVPHCSASIWPWPNCAPPALKETSRISPTAGPRGAVSRAEPMGACPSEMQYAIGSTRSGSDRISICWISQGFSFRLPLLSKRVPVQTARNARGRGIVWVSLSHDSIDRFDELMASTKTHHNPRGRTVDVVRMQDPRTLSLFATTS